MKTRPGEGCWYCRSKENTPQRTMYFCHEFDTYIHIQCICRRMCLEYYKDKTDPGLFLIAFEFKEEIIRYLQPRSRATGRSGVIGYLKGLFSGRWSPR